MTTYNTHLAAEFYVLSMLHRLGADATLTLGNKKAVDIVVTRGPGRTVTVDVKGVAGRFDWPADNINPRAPGHHVYALLSFEGRISYPKQVPEVWIVPAAKIKQFMRRYSNRVVVSRAEIKGKGEEYRGAWEYITGRTSGA